MAKTKCVKGKEGQGEGVIPCQLIQNFSKMKPYLVNFFLIWGGGYIVHHETCKNPKFQPYTFNSLRFMGLYIFMIFVNNGREPKKLSSVSDH